MKNVGTQTEWRKNWTELTHGQGKIQQLLHHVYRASIRCTFEWLDSLVAHQSTWMFRGQIGQLRNSFVIFDVLIYRRSQVYCWVAQPPASQMRCSKMDLDVSLSVMLIKSGSLSFCSKRNQNAPKHSVFIGEKGFNFTIKRDTEWPYANPREVRYKQKPGVICNLTRDELSIRIQSFLSSGELPSYSI